MHQPTREPNSLRPRSKATIVPVATQQLPPIPIAATVCEDTLLRSYPVPVLRPAPKEDKNCQTRIPVITGEARFKGTIPVDGILVGQLGGHGGSLGLRQKTGSVFAKQPELSGEISFRDMVRVNGHIAGTVYSKNGTLIVDLNATVDANIEVAVAVIGGTVRGDIVAHERIELGSGAKIYGNIWTRSLAVKDGAFFDGVCTMLEGQRPA